MKRRPVFISSWESRTAIAIDFFYFVHNFVSKKQETLFFGYLMKNLGAPPVKVGDHMSPFVTKDGHVDAAFCTR